MNKIDIEIGKTYYHILHFNNDKRIFFKSVLANISIICDKKNNRTRKKAYFKNLYFFKNEYAGVEISKNKKYWRLNIKVDKKRFFSSWDTSKFDEVYQFNSDEEALLFYEVTK